MLKENHGIAGYFRLRTYLTKNGLLALDSCGAHFIASAPGRQKP